MASEGETAKDLREPEIRQAGGRPRPLEFRLAWHPLALASVLLVPAAASFGRPFWDLPNTHGHLALGLGGAYIAAVLAMVAYRGFRGRLPFLARAAVTVAALCALYIVVLLLPGLQYSRLLLVLGSLLVAAGLLVPSLLPVSGKLLLVAPVALCAASAGLVRTEGSEEYVRRAKSALTSPTWSGPEFLGSTRHTLVATRYRDVLPSPVQPYVYGGAINRVPNGDGYLLVRGRGELFHVSFDEDGDIEVRYVGVRVPVNNAAFEEDVGPEVNVKWFRVADLLAWSDANGLRVLVTHHHWKREERCIVVRLSSATLSLEAGGIPVGSARTPWETVYETAPCLPIKEEASRRVPFAGLQIGGRLASLEDGRVLVTVGDHQFDGLDSEPILPQDPNVDYGKTLLVDLSDGTAEVFTLGHRNPQGLAVDERGRIWATEHGPEGGDELNLLRRDANYGWPYHTYGTDYGDVAWPLAGRQSLEDQVFPVYAWVPSIGVSNLIALDGSTFERWRGDLLVASLVGQTLWRMVPREGRIAYAEPIEVGDRIRDLERGHDGDLLLLTDREEIVRLRPGEGASEAAARFQHLCGGCHSTSLHGARGVGPNLRDVVGRQVASVAAFNYSRALERLEGDWTEDRLDSFLADPDALAPGTTMVMDGIRDPEVRQALIDYLASIE